MTDSYIQITGVSKIFPPDIVALDNISLDIRKGDIHSIIGENGAGKSTLMKVLYGLVKPNFGTIKMQGKELALNSPVDAVAKGIGMVHQEFMLVGEFSVLENIVLGVEPKKGAFIDLDAARKDVKEIIDLLSLSIDIDEKINNISIAAQQKVEIVKQLYRKVNILILDEPTAVLTPQECRELFRLLKELKNEGKTILFISHKLDEVLELSDRITVMRKGEHVWTRDNKGLSKEALANAMVGRSVLFTVEKEAFEENDVILEVSNLSYRDQATNQDILSDVSFKIKRGEIVGLAGVEGNGQTELINAITDNIGAEGEVKIAGTDISNFDTYSRRKFLAYVPQDRKTKGSCQTASLLDNLIMAHHYLNPDFVGRFGIINKNRVVNFGRKLLAKYQVNTSDLQVNMETLSGGNQQKIILAREFELGKDLLIVDQPVRGLDIGSIEFVHDQILKKRRNGVACLLVSADLDELLKLADTILVIYNGRITARKECAKTSKEEIGRYMLGAKA